jgi:hypothetical protein
MTERTDGRTLRWRTGDDRTWLEAGTEAEVVQAMRLQSQYSDVNTDSAYMRVVVARFYDLDGVTIRADNAANFVEDLVAVGHIEAAWVDTRGISARILPDHYKMARLNICGLAGQQASFESRIAEMHTSSSPSCHSHTEGSETT